MRVRAQAETRRKADLAAQHMSELDALALIRLEQRDQDEVRPWVGDDACWPPRHKSCCHLPTT